MTAIQSSSPSHHITFIITNLIRPQNPLCLRTVVQLTKDHHHLAHHLLAIIVLAQHCILYATTTIRKQVKANKSNDHMIAFSCVAQNTKQNHSNTTPTSHISHSYCWVDSPPLGNGPRSKACTGRSSCTRTCSGVAWHSRSWLRS